MCRLCYVAQTYERYDDMKHTPGPHSHQHISFAPNCGCSMLLTRGTSCESFRMGFWRGLLGGFARSGGLRRRLKGCRWPPKRRRSGRRRRRSGRRSRTGAEDDAQEQLRFKGKTNEYFGNILHDCVVCVFAAGCLLFSDPLCGSKRGVRRFEFGKGPSRH